MKSFIIAGTHSGVGKTTISIGIMAALRKRGYIVQPFKVGPDYIDPSHHRIACGRPSYNLDTWMTGVAGVKKTFARAMQTTVGISELGVGNRTSNLKPQTSVGIIEGVMGLFDGKDGRDEKGSTAHAAKVLGIPVILVVDAGSMARSAGALVYGYEKFDPKVKIAGVIFNRVGSERHFRMLKEAIEDKCKAKVLGYIPKDEEIKLPERHLGLIMPHEAGAWVRCRMGEAKHTHQKHGQGSKFKKLTSMIEKFIDVDKVLKLVSTYTHHASHTRITAFNTHRASRITRIAVAMDNAFCFYYQENLDMLEELGAELVFFSPLKDKRLPNDINGIYLGGGYPELFAKKLEANKSLRTAIKGFADKGFPIYAECGGLMYLGKGLKDLNGKKHEMAGVFPWVSRMLGKRKSLGYREIMAIDKCPFLNKGQKIRGHEYHYSEISEPPDNIKRVYRLTPHTSRLTASEGYLYRNTLASYIHLHFASNPKFAEGFVRACSLCPPD